MDTPSTHTPKVVITGRIPQEGVDLLRADHEVWAWDRDEPVPIDTRDRQLADAAGVLTLLTDRVDDRFLDAAPHLQVVANVAVGYNNIDVAACRARHVTVTNTPGVLTDATADMGMALLLSVTRRLGEGERLIRSAAAWEWSMFMLLGTGLAGKRLGVVGLGDIGQAFARRARAFGMEVVYHNRRSVRSEIERELGARLVSLDELLASSDVVSLHCPYTPETHHLIDAAALDMMRRSAYLINTARGPVVDEAALVAALRDGAIAGAGLDVYEDEPTVNAGLMTLDNVVLAPHLGSATVETRTAMAVLAARNVAAVLAGEAPPTPVV